MSRSEVAVRERNEANPRTMDNEPGPIIYSIAKAERTFRWISDFRNEPKFEIATTANSNGSDFPDRAA
jgi:hypothetical protein